MNGVDRAAAARFDRHIVTGTTGLLAAFNDAGVLGPLDVHAAEAIARIGGEADERVVLAAALAARGPRIGHVCIEPANQREAIVVDGQDPEVVTALPWPDPAEWESAIATSALVGAGDGDEPLVFDGGRLYLERYYRYEVKLAELITRRVALPSVPLDARYQPVLDRAFPGESGDNRQRRAVEIALTGNFTVIAGGPGTGKTYTVAALLAALASGADGAFPTVGLCAPTGKAAARLTEAVVDYTTWVDEPEVRDWLEGLEAQTIHRLMGFSWRRGRFDHDAGNPLPYDWVIVDEMSMVSLPQAAKLLDAVPDSASLVIVGDPFQLTSIEAGTVLADIVGPAVDAISEGQGGGIEDRVVVLNRIHRFKEGGAIAGLAAAVRAGDGDATLAVLGSGADDVEWIADPASAAADRLLERIVSDRTQMVRAGAQVGGEEEALELLTGLAVLSAHRRGPGSVAHWQQAIETALDEQFTGLRYHGEWYPGRPVMITENDYNLGLFNGDIGVAVTTDEGLRVRFERRGAWLFHPSHLGERATVHALTIHKSQGSQFGEVVVILPQQESRLLTRELLYTAVTRASDKVTVVGDENSIREAVARPVDRASGLEARLWNPGEVRD